MILGTALNLDIARSVSNFYAIMQDLLPVIWFELIIIIIVIFIVIVLLSGISEWWAKRGVKEVAPQLPQYPTGGGGGGGNEFWALLKEKIKKLFGKT